LAAWRRSKNPNAAERAEKILRQMHQLYENDILLIKPNFKSYQTVLDTWEKSSQLDAAQKAEEFLLSSSDYKTDKRLVKKVRYIKSRHEKRNRRLQKENEL
jgi:CRISPR/Cas system type I-B associated protein Csh2 (Cas7 group RAMP superfamily)